MVITFFSNYYNHHQKALCDSLATMEQVTFYFVETEPMEAFRKNMGWGQEEVPGYVLRAHEDAKKKQRAMDLSMSSDVVMIGSAPEEYVEKRIEANKLTFRYTERPMKEGFIKMFIPRLAKKFYRLHYKNRDKKLYLLGASAYAAADYKILRSYPGKCLKFGYFPEEERNSFEVVSAQKDKSECVEILWTGRFLKLKRAELLLKALGRLKKRGLNFHLRLIGNGEREAGLKTLTEKLGLSDRVDFSDFVKPSEVRGLMEKADIYVMTSSFLEGWGSVIYEALSAGCAVVASHACGCTPWLVKPEDTGLVFKNGSVDSLEDKLYRFMTDEKLRHSCQKNAYEQMNTLWNPMKAAERIVEFSKSVLETGEMKKFDEGPLSPAPILKNNWYRE